MRILSQCRSEHLSSLLASNWKDSLTVVYLLDGQEETEGLSSELEVTLGIAFGIVPEIMQDAEFDNSIDQAVYLDDISD